eukprot:11906197-Alexandrium_andersonii.AAC.1
MCRRGHPLSRAALVNINPLQLHRMSTGHRESTRRSRFPQGPRVERGQTTQDLAWGKAREGRDSRGSARSLFM